MKSWSANFKKVQSDPVLIRPKLAFSPDPVRSSPDPCSSLITNEILGTPTQCHTFEIYVDVDAG